MSMLRLLWQTAPLILLILLLYSQQSLAVLIYSYGTLNLFSYSLLFILLSELNRYLQYRCFNVYVIGFNEYVNFRSVRKEVVLI